MKAALRVFGGVLVALACVGLYVLVLTRGEFLR